MAQNSERMKHIDHNGTHKEENHIQEVTILKKQLYQTKKAKKNLEATLRKKEVDLERVKALLAQQQKNSVIWGLNDDD